jgi:hypothetical protein
MTELRLTTQRGNEHDARYLALIDSLTGDSEPNRQERVEYWKQWEFSRHPEPPNVWVARIGGLYAGYLAIRDTGQFDIRVQERFDVGFISEKLLDRAGVQIITPATVDNQEGLAVA